MIGRAPRTGRRRIAGFSLIELLVSMAIAMVTSLAITAVLVGGERGKRSTTSVNDLNQTGAYIAYVFDRHVRSAGSGFAQRWLESFGCRLHASRSGTVIQPRPAALAAPFDNAPLASVMAPVVIQAGGADTSGAGAQVRGDLVTVMAGTAAFSGSAPLALINSVHGNAGSGDLSLPNTLGYQNGDIVLLADSGVAQGCMAQQVAGLPSGGGGASVMLPLAGDYYAATGSGIALGNFGGATYALQLGNLPGNPPQFFLYGVGDKATLFSHDLFNFDGGSDLPVPVADGVVEMRAIYGLDTTTPPDGRLDVWVLPDSASGFDQAALSDGSSTARQKLRQIIAVRLGFVLRSTLREKEMQLGSNYSTATQSYTLRLFDDLVDAGHDVSRTRAVGGDDRYYKFRTVEVTVPLRNVMLAPAS